MVDISCIIMGIMDIIAGALVIIAFQSNIFAILFGIIMIGKGGFSFI